jgi:GxxExxY protein
MNWIKKIECEIQFILQSHESKFRQNNSKIKPLNNQKMKEQIQDDLTYKIIGCAMKVHSYLGNVFQEVIYQRALAIEMTNQGVSFAREVEMPIFYDNQNIGSRRVDFVVANEIVVELKAIIQLEDVHLAQGLNYLVAYKMDKGLLINFGAKSLDVKRLRHPRGR